MFHSAQVMVGLATSQTVLLTDQLMVTADSPLIQMSGLKMKKS